MLVTMSSLSMVGNTRDGTQVLLLKEGTSETRGRQALKNNIAAAKIIASLLKTSLGPRGMDKMIVDSMGGVTITNDGATILKEIDVQHPAARMLVEVAKAVDDEVGDGTTSSVVIAGALLEKAEELLNQGIHPTVIVDGYRKALRQALDILNKIAEDVELGNDHVVLKNVARTSMESKIVSVDSDALADMAVEAVLAVAEALPQLGAPDGNGYAVIDLDNVKIQKKPGGAMRDSSLIKGIIIDKEIAHSGMPRIIKDAKILLLNTPLEIEKTEFDAKITIDRPEQIKTFLAEENRMLKSMVDKIATVQANVIICQKGIDDVVLEYLTRANISAVKRVNESDINALAKATGARPVTNLDDLSTQDLGFAQLVEERRVENDKWVFVEKCKNPKAVSVLIRGGSERVVEEAERSMHDALMAVKDVVQKPAIVAGGGSTETYVANKLRIWASGISGRQHYAILAFADALDSIPIALAENTGMDIIDTLAALHSKQLSENNPWIGVDVKGLKVADMRTKNVIEPLIVKEQVLRSATETTAMLLRIDDVLSASRSAAA
jgi:archaeal chaperonin